MTQKYFDHSPRLEEVAQFAFEMLGDFWNDVGLTSDQRINKYKENDSTIDFSKYNLHDPKQDLAKGFVQFEEKVKMYNANSMELMDLMEFPNCLLDGITRLTLTYSESRAINFERVAKLYVNYQIIYLNKKIFNCNSFQEIQVMVAESYDSIIKEKPDLNFKQIDETATWKNVSTYLDDIKNCKLVTEETKCAISTKIIRHYVFNHFLRALSKVFEVNVTEIRDYYKNADFNKIFNKIIDKITWLRIIQNYEGVYRQPSIWDWIFPKAGTKEKTNDFNQFTGNFTEEGPLTKYFLCSNDRLNLERAYQLLRHLRKNFPDNPQADFFHVWFQARTEIFSLKFDGSDGDTEKIEKARKLYRATFQQFRYIAGKNLQEFLFDALAMEIYFNQKQKILDNTQDNSEESSLSKLAKAYWEFSYAVGLLKENSKKTYCCAYNVAKNFWWAFPVHKFIHTEKAKERFAEEIQNEELNLPTLLYDYSDKKKIDNLLSKTRKDLRQKVGKRYYSNLSIAIMKAKLPSDFDNISNYIRAMDAEKLAVNDECGATPLIRALHEYKCCQLYFFHEYRRERGTLLFQWNNEQEEINSHLGDNSTDSKMNQGKRADISWKYFQKLMELGKKYGQNFVKEQRQYLKARQKALKEQIIIPLIEKVPPESLLDEALQLDAFSCVTALQLAIDSWDADLVERIVERIPQNLSNYYISDEYTTPLQYAIRRYDFVQLNLEKFGKEKHEKTRFLSSVPKRKLTVGGIFDKEQISANLQNEIPPVLSIVPTENLGFNLDRESKVKNFTKIIHLLADRTKPISVDSFYHLIDQMDPEDQVPYNEALDFAKYFLETGNADMTTTDKEWTRKTKPFSYTTILGYCIDKHNYPMLQLFLESQYTEQLKKIINLRLLFTDEKTNRQRYQTDPLMFVQNMILNIDCYSKDPEKYHNYGKMTADRLNLLLTLFHKVGADFDLPDQDGKSIRDYLREWKDKFPQGAIPEFLGV